MIYIAIAGWILAIAGWWGAWNVFCNLRDYVQIARQREQALIQERLRMVNDLQKAIDAAAAAYNAQNMSRDRTLN